MPFGKLATLRHEVPRRLGSTSFLAGAAAGLTFRALNPEDK
jgi:hypothetical protein